MNLQKRILYVIVVLSTVLAVDLLFLHIVFPAKKERHLKELNKEVISSLEEHPPSIGQKLDQVFNNQNNGAADFKTVSQACLGSAWSSYESFPEELKKVYDVQSQVVDIENYHLKLPTGEERRIHIVADGRNNKTVRFFGLDSEGLPNPIPIENDLRSKPADEAVEELKKQGEVTFHQTKERWLLGNGTTLLVTFENNKPYEFQLFGPDKTLSCLKDSCQCR